MHPFLVSSEHVALLDELRAALQRLEEAAGNISSKGPEQDELATILDHLDETFLVVVVGEVKSGKSSLVNALLRTEVCAVGPTPVTDRITILRHGDAAETRIIDDGLAELTVPSDRLIGLSIVDTPGTNSIIRRHEAITRGFLPRADLVLFVTSCDRPYTESENAFLHLIFGEWRRKIVFVLAKTDIKDPPEVEEIEEYVDSCCREQLGFSPTVIPVSVKYAEWALEEDDHAAFVGSGLAALEEFVLERLDAGEKVRLRLHGLGDAAAAVLERLRGSLARDREVLDEDHGALADIELQAEWKRAELKGGHHQYLSRLTELFHRLHDRGAGFLEQRFRLKNVLGRIRRGHLKERFREEVVGDLPDRIVAVLEDAVGWLSEETVRFTHYALELFTFKLSPNRAKAGENDRIGTAFEQERIRAIDRVRDRAAEHLKAFSPQKRSREILKAAGQGLGISAAGLDAGVLSAAVATLFVSAWWSVVALPFVAAAWIVLGTKRSKALRAWSERVADLELRFKGTLTEEIERGIDNAMDGVKSVYEPYKSFYDAEIARNAAHGVELDRIGEALRAIRAKVEAITGGRLPGPEAP